jgi:SAM-dependent methyltransferase
MSKIREEFGTVEGLRVVELGSGRGDVSFLLAEAGARVTLIDSNGVALEQSRALFETNHLSAEFVNADLFGMNLTNASYDVSMSFGLIEHYRGAEQRQLFALHRTGKVAFVSVPNALCLPYRLWKLVLESTELWPYGFEMPFTKAGLITEMARCFTDVSLFVTPLSYHLGRRLGLPASLSLPFDSKLGYQLVAFGRHLTRPRSDKPMPHAIPPNAGFEKSMEGSLLA